MSNLLVHHLASRLLKVECKQSSVRVCHVQHASTCIVGDPAATLTLTLAVTWPGLSWSSVEGEVRYTAPVRHPGGKRERGRRGGIGWVRRSIVVPTNDRDLAPGSGKGFDSHANMYCHLKRETKRVCAVWAIRPVCLLPARVRQPRKCVTVAGSVKREIWYEHIESGF